MASAVVAEPLLLRQRARAGGALPGGWPVARCWSLLFMFLVCLYVCCWASGWVVGRLVGRLLGSCGVGDFQVGGVRRLLCGRFSEVCS